MVIIFTTRQSQEVSEIEINIWGEEKQYSYKSPIPVGPYSKYKKSWNFYFFSGQIGLNPETNELVEWWIREEAIQICRNLKALLQEVNLGLKDVIKTTIFLKDISDFKKVNDIYKDYFILKPARTTVEVSNLPKWALLEIEIIASYEPLSF